MKKYIFGLSLISANFLFAQKLEYNPNRAPIKIENEEVAKPNFKNKGQKIIVRDLKISNEKPLFVVDGKIIEEKEFQNIDPNNIESIEILKDENAVKVFGENAKKGAIIINTKSHSQPSQKKEKQKQDLLAI